MVYRSDIVIMSTVEKKTSLQTKYDKFPNVVYNLCLFVL